MLKVKEVITKKKTKEIKKEIIDLINRYLELEEKYTEITAYYKELDEVMNELSEKIGVGSSFQDNEKTVYQLAPCLGGWVTYRKYKMNRTKREGEEAKASLSWKSAEGLGYSK